MSCLPKLRIPSGTGPWRFALRRAFASRRFWPLGAATNSRRSLARALCGARAALCLEAALTNAERRKAEIAEETELLRAKARRFIAARDEALKEVAQIDDLYQSELCRYNQALVERDQKFVELKHKLADYRVKSRVRREKITKLRSKISALGQRSLDSTVWKITIPARTLVKILRRKIANKVSLDSPRGRSTIEAGHLSESPGRR